MSADMLAALVAERDWIMGLLNVPGLEVNQVPDGLGEFTYRTPNGLYRVRIELIAETPAGEGCNDAAGSEVAQVRTD